MISRAWSVAGAAVYLDRDMTRLPELLFGDSGEGSVHVICDTNTVRDCVPLTGLQANEPIVIPAGEAYKTVKTCEDVWDQLIAQGADRQSIVVNVGGGVVTDLGGFCAATYLRGIRFVHLPTTLLAMCDAAFGGKHGVDFRDLKNYIGVFAQPAWVWVNTGFLETLPERHLRNGMAEVIKHALIGDRELFASLEKTTFEDSSRMNWQDLVSKAVAVKKRFVEGDIREEGKRAALNFGHTLGHAVESCALQAGWTMLHGECVALGMQLECRLGTMLDGYPGDDVCATITKVLEQWVPVEVPGEIPLSSLLTMAFRDKKQRSQTSSFSLIRHIGEPRTHVRVTPEDLKTFLGQEKIAAQFPWIRNDL
jgi:3-dehydroquinate synthase